MEETALEILQSFANFEDKYFESEIIFATDEIEKPVDDQLVIGLMNRLEEMSFEDWPKVAFAIVEVFQNATTDKMKTDSLASIISYNTKLRLSQIDSQLGWTEKAKKAAIKYLALQNSREALDAIAKGLSQHMISSDAAEVLVQSEYGIECLTEYIKENGELSHDAINVLARKESERIAKFVLDLLDQKPRWYTNFLHHSNESIRAKAESIFSGIRVKAAAEFVDEDEISLESVKIINYQDGNARVETVIKGRKKTRFPHRNIRERSDGLAFFKCPFCSNLNEVYGDYCEHVVYVYETENGYAFTNNDQFLDTIIKLISSDPSVYIDDFEGSVEEYVSRLNYSIGQQVVIDLDAYRQILEDQISPSVIDSVIESNGLPNKMRSLTEYSITNFLGDGIYYYLISDEDLGNLVTP